MKTITKNQDNVIECTCGTVLEYDNFDLTLKSIEKTDYYAISVVCPSCGKNHTVKPADFDDKALIRSVNHYKRNLDDMTPKELSIAANSPIAKEIFAIHERITITLKNGYNAVFEIIGIKHDVREDGEEAGLTFCLVDLYGTSEDSGVKMNKNHTNKGGFEESDMFKWLNVGFFALLPDEWQEVIVPVVKKTASGGSSKVRIDRTTCRIFIPSEIEVFGECYYSSQGEGELYKGFKNWKDRIKSYPDESYGRKYWLRSPYKGCGDHFCVVFADGASDGSRAGDYYGVAPCFAI